MSSSVSVVIPTYNRQDMLPLAVRSALCQTLKPLEIIVVDDGSPSSPLVSLGELCDAVVYLKQDRTLGANAARNRGARAAKGEFVAFLDDDDTWLPTKLEKQVASLTRQGADACLCGYEVLGSAKRRVRKTTALCEEDVRQMRQVAGFSALLVRRDIACALALDETLPSAQDWDFYARLIRRGKIAYVPEALYRYRLSDRASITSKVRTASIEELERRTATLRKHRIWMGERRFRQCLADHYLSHLLKRAKPLPYLLHSIRHAGLAATGHALLRRLSRRL